ncbi:hypothetical protein [Nodosilinea sp. FACHB-13]|uniref:hypothetical protein n=1 Tax=Cyanophyceae TaxID=3028117 RepID=UPI001682372E|nr:hypothetical protein [Nodosilinea sp. FACHB-13]MBD2107407.1 hypothetical protein [Nodosilinea sp. FACHB-13]
MPRPPKWNNPTDSVRLPKHAIPACMALARQLDGSKPVEDVKNNVQNLLGPSMLTSESRDGTYRLFLKPPPELPPNVEASIEEYCDRVFDGLTETDWVYLLTRLVEEWGVKVDD